VDVSGSTGFATTSFPLNPGQAATFPWLAGEAKLFEKYRFLACEFYYRPQVSAYGLNGQAGKVMISCDYDASDAPPANKQQVEDTHPHADCMPYEEVHLSLETAEMFNTSDAKYVRPGGLPGAADIKTYDAGTISVSTVGNQNTTNIGELRVRYTVELSVPVLESATTAPVNNSVTWYQSTSPEALTTATPTTLALASKYANGLGAVNTSGSFVLPAGNYLVDIYGVFEDTATETFEALLNLDYNGVNVGNSNNKLIGNIAAGVTPYITLSGSYFVVTNGTAAITVIADAIGAAGTLTCEGSIRIIAI